MFRKGPYCLAAGSGGQGEMEAAGRRAEAVPPRQMRPGTTRLVTSVVLRKSLGYFSGFEALRVDVAAALDFRIDSNLYNSIVAHAGDRRPTLRSGELAKRTGVSADTLRWYERRGLLPRPTRTSNGYRAYPAAAVQRVEVIQAALAVGFSVADLTRIFGIRDRGGAPCRDVRQLAGARLDALDRQIAELNGLRRDLRRTLRDWDSRLGRVGSDERAGLLDALASYTRRRAHGVSLTPPWARNRIKQGDRR
jgi:DNA-binding transcriptional MerR regulator